MDIQASSNTVTITGNIKTVSDFQQIKQTLDSIVSAHKTVILKITDSLSMTSSVIGYFNKLVLKDNIDIQMKIGNEQLLELLNDLNLTSTFNAKKV
jgi:hypothetical protein